MARELRRLVTLAVASGLIVLTLVVWVVGAIRTYRHHRLDALTFTNPRVRIDEQGFVTVGGDPILATLSAFRMMSTGSDQCQTSMRRVDALAGLRWERGLA